MKHVSPSAQQNSAIPLDDRLPTFHELASFDAGKAWDRLEAQITAVWPRTHIQLVESAARTVFQTLCEHFDPLWPQLFGWLPGKEVKRQP
jgi:hypothetical protein